MAEEIVCVSRRLMPCSYSPMYSVDWPVMKIPGAHRNLFIGAALRRTNVLVEELVEMYMALFYAVRSPTDCHFQMLVPGSMTAMVDDDAVQLESGTSI